MVDAPVLGHRSLGPIGRLKVFDNTDWTSNENAYLLVAILYRPVKLAAESQKDLVIRSMLHDHRPHVNEDDFGD